MTSDNGLTAEDMQILRPLFVTSGRSYVATLREGLLLLGNGRTERVTFTAMHRAAHSLKGAAMQIGFLGVGTLARLIEEAIAGISEVPAPLPGETLAALEESTSLLSAGLDAVERGEMPPEPAAPIRARLAQLAPQRKPGEDMERRAVS